MLVHPSLCAPVSLGFPHPISRQHFSDVHDLSFTVVIYRLSPGCAGIWFASIPTLAPASLPLTPGYGIYCSEFPYGIPTALHYNPYISLDDPPNLARASSLLASLLPVFPFRSVPIPSVHPISIPYQIPAVSIGTAPEFRHPSPSHRCVAIFHRFIQDSTGVAGMSGARHTLPPHRCGFPHIIQLL